MEPGGKSRRLEWVTEGKGKTCVRHDGPEDRAGRRGVGIASPCATVPPTGTSGEVRAAIGVVWLVRIEGGVCESPPLSGAAPVRRPAPGLPVNRPPDGFPEPLPLLL